MKLLQKKDIPPISLVTGDTFRLVHHPKEGPPQVLLERNITQSLVVDRVAVAEVRNELGFEEGLAGIFGQRKGPK